ncbi:TPA: 4a-hydroxytetrahydrobiopterin dehydratase [archaeon]|jgi:4a-hydroxytetrahydrobiopterin dehydratase|uniref:Putative pterin-4-alpha-carbinolamine dehydratase n=1 Tax=Candidatus Undinarchaeum marinum TaxID=2756141 RepID=A0A832UYJ1_9ARCH|nr:4a-hydroxytetrahydrobiopterin dehydratase [Candidatus Undinarchaeum marinum]
MVSELTKMKCKPCEGGVPPLKGEDLQKNLEQVEGWEIIEEHHLVKEWKFPDFKTALEFVNNIGEIAEEQGHHPNIDFTWGKVKISFWTHSIGGLSVNDFIMAAKIDDLEI